MKLPNWFLRLGEALMESEAPPRRWTPPLTTEEREAIEWAAEMIPAMAHPSSCSAHIHAATLRALLERTKS